MVWPDRVAIMCGRYLFTSPLESIQRMFRLDHNGPGMPSWVSDFVFLEANCRFNESVKIDVKGNSMAMFNSCLMIEGGKMNMAS